MAVLSLFLQKKSLEPLGVKPNGQFPLKGEKVHRAGP